MATFQVTTALDINDPNDGVTSFREAVQQANATAGVDTISFSELILEFDLVTVDSEISVTESLLV